MSDLNQYVVKAGKRFGSQLEYGPGQIVELTAAEYLGFSDLLQPVTPEAEPYPADYVPLEVTPQVSDEPVTPEPVSVSVVSAKASLTDLTGVGDSLAEKLTLAGFDTVEAVAAADPAALAEVDGISQKSAPQYIENAQELMS